VFSGRKLNSISITYSFSEVISAALSIINMQSGVFGITTFDINSLVCSFRLAYSVYRQVDLGTGHIKVERASPEALLEHTLPLIKHF